MIATAMPSPFGRGTETVFDASVRNSLEINAELLNQDTLKQISDQFKLHKLSSSMNLEARPYKLVIYQEGGHFKPHRDTVRADNHVGTVVVILRSDFEGGELCVTSGGNTITVSKPDTWVAMFGDCVHEIRPVTKGVRVSLLYDLFASDEVDPMDEDESEDEDENGINYIAAVSASEEDRVALVNTLTENMSSTPAVVIALQHLYPESQSSLHFCWQ